jgi:DNA end-binding protein Ku
MAARSISTATISFGLVTVPVRVYPAIQESGGLSFHLLHSKDGVRLRQQYICPKDGEVVPRTEMVKGYEIAKGRYVTFTNEELKALDEHASQGIEITEFVPEAAVDPIYFERAYYLGPDKGGERAYKLLAEAMAQVGRSAVAKYAARGKSYLVLLRSIGSRLVMEQLYHSDEVREIEDVPAGSGQMRENELKLATQLIDQVTAEEFHPEKYEDEVRARIQKLIRAKAKGEEITAPPREKAKGEVIDLMDALKASLARGGARPRAAAARRTAHHKSSPRAARKSA